MTLSRLLSRSIPIGLHLALARAAHPAVDGEPAVDEAVGGAAHRQHLVVAVAREEKEAVVLWRGLPRPLAALVAAPDDAAGCEGGHPRPRASPARVGKIKTKHSGAPSLCGGARS